MGGVINQKHGVLDGVFLFEFQGTVQLTPSLLSKTADSKDSLRVRIDSNVQPVLLTVDSDYRLVQRNLIPGSHRLWAADLLCAPAMNCFSRALDTEILKFSNCI